MSMSATLIFIIFLLLERQQLLIFSVADVTVAHTDAVVTFLRRISPTPCTHSLTS